MVLNLLIITVVTCGTLSYHVIIRDYSDGDKKNLRKTFNIDIQGNWGASAIIYLLQLNPDYGLWQAACRWINDFNTHFYR